MTTPQCPGCIRVGSLAIVLLSFVQRVMATGPQRGIPKSPPRAEGPFEQLIVRGATLIDGTAAPPIDGSRGEGEGRLRDRSTRHEATLDAGRPKERKR